MFLGNSSSCFVFITEDEFEKKEKRKKKKQEKEKMAERTYSVITEGQEIVAALAERYPEVLWQVRPAQIAVLGIDNKEPTKRSKDFQVRSVRNAEKAVLQMHNVKTRYIIEFYWARWNTWDTARKEWAILNSLLRISVDEGKLIRPDCVEFKILLDKVSFDWDSEGAVLPSLTVGDPVEFDLDLRPGLDEDEESDGDNNDDND
jgi:hypothetical protein